MSNIILSKDDFGLKMYNRFPPRYREDDIGQDFALKRYLEACADGGMSYTIEELNGILDLANPDMAIKNALPLLFEQYGLPIFNGIPEEYLRYLLPKLGEAWSKKGSIEVIEFIVSALSGVRTEVVTRYDAQRNVDLDVRLEMDYNIGSYFPSTSQFNRLLDYFVPFYVGRNIIYVYVFHDKAKLYVKEPYFRDHVHHVTSEWAFIPYAKGYHPIINPALNIDDVVLNDNLILNGESSYYYEIDPDWFTDTLKLVQSESASIASVWSEYYRHTLNAIERRLNDNLLTNEFWHTDEFLDTIKTKPVNDTGVVYMYDVPRLDALRIDETFRYYATLNTGLMLNVDLMTNSSNSDAADLRVEEDFVEVPRTVYTDTPKIAAERSTEYYREELNRSYSLNDDFTLNGYLDTDSSREDIHEVTSESAKPGCKEVRLDHFKWDNYGVLPMLNVNTLTLNDTYTLNRSFHETADVKMVDTYKEDTVGFLHSDSAGFETSKVLDTTMGMFTNTDESVLNTGVMSVPDEIDTIRYRDGTVVTVFPSILKMVGAK